MHRVQHICKWLNLELEPERKGRWHTLPSQWIHYRSCLSDARRSKYQSDWPSMPGTYPANPVVPPPLRRKNEDSKTFKKKINLSFGAKDPILCWTQPYSGCWGLIFGFLRRARFSRYLRLNKVTGDKLPWRLVLSGIACPVFDPAIQLEPFLQQICKPSVRTISATDFTDGVARTSIVALKPWAPLQDRYTCCEQVKTNPERAKPWISRIIQSPDGEISSALYTHHRVHRS